MEETGKVRKFEYRPYRVSAGFAVEFTVGGQVLHGMCRDVNDNGLRAEFDGAIDVGLSGVLVLRHPTGTLEIEAQVGYQNGTQIALTFLFKSDWERSLAMEFIAGVANHEESAPFVRFQ